MFQAKQWSYTAMAAGILLLSSCGGGGGSSPTAPGMGSPKTVQVQIVDFAFNPKDVSINTGDTVMFVLNSGTYTHTATAEDGSFDSGTSFSKPGGTFSHTFTQLNTTVNYHCNTHWHTNGMQGSITVGNGPPAKPGY
jgi:plastocyanin